MSRIEPVTDILHGVSVADPYRWLEDQNSLETGAWIAEQTRYARAYLDNIPGRDRIRERVRELLDVETCDSFLKARNRYFFRKRLPGEEQPSIYMRERPEGEDQLLVDPKSRKSGDFTAVKPLQVSGDGGLLLYEVKQGGEHASTYEILDIYSRKIQLDRLPHGYLRGFAFAPDGKSFYYVHEATSAARPFYRAAFHHVLGTDFREDKEVFHAGVDQRLRLVLVSGPGTLGFLVHCLSETTYVDFYLLGMGSTGHALSILRDADYSFLPRLLPGRIVALTNHQAPNRRIVEVQPRKNQNPLYFDLISERDVPIRRWALTANHMAVSYIRGTHSEIRIFDRFGKSIGDIPCDAGATLRIASSSATDDELLLERESFTQPIEVVRYECALGLSRSWAQRTGSLDQNNYSACESSFLSRDRTAIPIFLVGKRDMLPEKPHPAVMTAYGGFGIPMTPQFCVLAAVLIENGCWFALPNIRGGSEFGAGWREAARRQHRQNAFDDFLCAAEWLISTGRTSSGQLAIFGGSNSGLLVGVALTQRPDLFRAAVCMLPILDMLRYHRFDRASGWRHEFGTSEDADGFLNLSAYSPYHQVRSGEAYPATLIVSGDVDGRCNPLHARKMTARMQAATSSQHPVLLDYSPYRGHSPVLPLSERINGLTDRIAFFSEELQLRL